MPKPKVELFFYNQNYTGRNNKLFNIKKYEIFIIILAII